MVEGNRVGPAVSAVARVCTANESADELLAELSEVVHRWIPHDGAVWFGVDPVTLLATAPSRVEGLDPSLCDVFWHLEFHEHDIGLFTDLAREGRADALQLTLDGCPNRSIRYRDFMRPQGLGDELRGVFASHGSTWGMAGLYRDARRDRFDEDDLAILRAIGPHVADAIRIHVRTSTPWVAQTTSPGLIVIDHEGRTVSTNAEALHWLQELWPISPSQKELASSGLLDLRDPRLEVPTPLHALVSRARAVAEGLERTPARLRVRDRRGRWVVMHASSLTATGTHDADLIAVVVEAAKSAEVAPIIIEAYSLTPRERDVLSAVSRGGSTAEIAAELFLSPHTVRDHIKTVFEKFEVSSRGELVARLFGEHYSDRLHDTMVDAR